MKANRKFVEADEAVSPVIAVILMVAITVVLAATVFVLVSDIGANTSKTQPSVGWGDSEVDDSWKVNQAPQQIKWTAYQIKVAGATAATAPATEIMVSLNGDTTQDFALETGYQAMPVNAIWDVAMAGGDELTFCDTTVLTVEDDIKITLLHTESNSVAHEYTFQDILTTC